MKISKQILKLEKIANKLGWDITGDETCLELIWGTNNIIFYNNENKQDILNTIDEELEDVKDEEFRQQLLTLHKVAERIIRTNYEKEKPKKTIFNKLLTLY